jgi:hypothetical protein
MGWFNLLCNGQSKFDPDHNIDIGGTGEEKEVRRTVSERAQMTPRKKRTTMKR